jgi:hypothetical protein
MIKIIKWLINQGLSWLTGGTLDRVLSTVDKSIDNETERQGIRAKAVSNYVETQEESRRMAMHSRVFWAVWALFSAPLGLWFAAVILDTIFAFPWSVADLPESVKPWANTIFGSIFGSGASVAAVQLISSAIRGKR